MKNKIVLILNMVTILVAAASTKDVSAEIKPEDEIKFRQSGMMFMRWNMGKIKTQIVEDPQTYKKEDVIAAANVIAAIANAGMGELFSPESIKGKGWKETRLKAEYFKQPEEAKKAIVAFQNQANQLVKVTQNADLMQIKTQFKKLFKACKSCHKRFRSKKQLN